MKVYKYRAVPPGDELAFERLERIVRHRLLWCAKPDALNDQTEFAWACDFTESPITVDLVAALLEELKGRPRPLARQIAISVIREGRLGDIGGPVIDDMIQRSRDGIGVACFGTSPDNCVLWKRYGGGGAGVCVEFEIPDWLLGNQLHEVVYDDHRRLHVDDFLRSRHDLHYGTAVYATLLTKTRFWAPEAEIRFLSKKPEIEVRIDGSEVTQVVVGPKVEPHAAARVRDLAGATSVTILDHVGLTRRWCALKGPDD